MKVKNEDSDVPLPKRWVGCSIEEEYFGDERKSHKAERKMASAKDRSKYKKTDRRKLEGQQKTTQSGSLERGRVLSIASQDMIVECDSEIICCTLRGSLKKDKTQAKNLVVVGDFVLFERGSPGQGFIVQVEPRHSVLSRAENLSRRKEQLIAANIDQVIITVSVVSPPLKPPLVDRYIIAAKKGGMEPVVVINKIDLLVDPQVDAAIREQELALYTDFISAYKAAGVIVLPISVAQGEGIDALQQTMTNKASVFSGQSGVGKTSLINAITGQDLRIGKMTDKTNKGSHTTTSAQLLLLSFGGWCIDTPGIKSFGVWDLDKEEIQQYFPEIYSKGRECRYPDCFHFTEENCAVVKSVEAGEISLLRYDSYLSLLVSITRGHFKR